jgi:hypothetical protein
MLSGKWGDTHHKSVTKTVGPLLQVHPFGGLRGDSKLLYGKLRRGQEPRARLIQTKEVLHTVYLSLKV